MTVTLDIEGPLATLTFRNETGIHTLSTAFRRDLRGALETIETSACRVVFLRAEGKTFLAGADLKELAALDADGIAETTWDIHGLMNRLARLPQVTIAAIHAACLGGGLELALACDLRIGARSARLGTPEVSLGLLPGWGGMTRLPRLLGPHGARRLILTGEALDAGEALRLGLLTEVVEEGELEARSRQYVDRLLSHPPEALRRAKLWLADGEAAGNESQIREALAFIAAATSDEGREGMRAFVEKRNPGWRGDNAR